jgi:hypothetical protein
MYQIRGPNIGIQSHKGHVSKFIVFFSLDPHPLEPGIHSNIHDMPGKDFTPWVYALYRVNKRILTRKIGHFRVTLRDITP